MNMTTACNKRAMSEAFEECPVCMESYQPSGPRTKVCPFLCEGRFAHAVCSACDRTLYVRGEDRCPICRSTRSGSSVIRNGPRTTIPPHHAAMADISNVIGWLPRRVGADGRRTVDGLPTPRPQQAGRSEASSAAGAYGQGGGVRVFYPTDAYEVLDFSGGFVAAYQRLTSERRRQGVPVVDLTEGGVVLTPVPVRRSTERTPPNPAPGAISLMDDEIRAAVFGLTNLAETTARLFALNRQFGSARRRVHPDQ